MKLQDQVRNNTDILKQHSRLLNRWQDTRLERDVEGKILLADDHLKSVVRLSRDFKSYLDELHKADESKRARKRFDRFDA